MNDPIINPPAIVCPAEDLAALFALANAEHEAGQRAERAGLEHYRKAGDALLRAKAAAGHGRWLTVLREQCRIPQQRASEYMRLASGWGELPPGGDFSLKGALSYLSAPARQENPEAPQGRPGAEPEAATEDLRDLYSALAELGELDEATEDLPEIRRDLAYRCVSVDGSLLEITPHPEFDGFFFLAVYRDLDTGNAYVEYPQRGIRLDAKILPIALRALRFKPAGSWESNPAPTDGKLPWYVTAPGVPGWVLR
jgi:hypothetical protein